MSMQTKERLANLNEQLDLINPIMRPEEVREGELITCYVRNGHERSLVKLWSYCPFGFEFIWTGSETFELGKSLEFDFVFGRFEFRLSGKVVFAKANAKGQMVVGIRSFYGNGVESNRDVEKRQSNRWNCPSHLLPSGSASNPIRFNDYIFFRIIDISANGLKFATSLRNKFLAVGQSLDCTISVPMIGTMCITVKITRCSIETVDNKPQLILGVTFSKNDEVTSSILSEFLLTFAENCSVKSLAAAGFGVQPSHSKFDFSYVKTRGEYEEVLKLRFGSYSHSGKLNESVTPDFMKDEFDTRARILVVKINGQIVGSARTMFHEPGDKTSHERYLEYPKGFPSIQDCIEVSRVCVDPNFQGIGLAQELAKHIALLAIKSGRKYVFLSAAGSLVEFWLRLGYRKTGVSYAHQDMGNLQHELLLNKVENSILGRGIALSDWNLAYAGLYDYCSEFGLIEPSLLDTAKNTLARLLRRTK